MSCLRVIGRACLRWAAASACVALAIAARAASFELNEDDRVVFLGDTFLEREGDYGFIEAALARRFADRNVTFRKIGRAHV